MTPRKVGFFACMLLVIFFAMTAGIYLERPVDWLRLGFSTFMAVIIAWLGWWQATGYHSQVKEHLTRKKTHRGFKYYSFTDYSNVICSLQQSSTVEPMVWLGCDDPDPKMFVPGKGWQKIKMPEEYIANNRMHIDTKLAAALWPVLKKFSEDGKI